MISTLCKQIKQYKRETILTPILVAIEVVLDILIPFLMSKMVNEGVNTGDMAVVWNYGLLMLLCAVGALITGGLSGKYAAVASAGFAKTCATRNFATFRTSRFPILTSILPAA